MINLYILIYEYYIIMYFSYEILICLCNECPYLKFYNFNL